MMSDISRYEAILKDFALPPRPRVVAALFAEMSRDMPDLQRVSRTIAADPALAASVLKVANSPLFGLARKVATVGQAVTLLGLRQASAIATGIAIRHALGGNADAASDKFWNDAERSAMIGAYLARSEKEARICARLARSLRGLCPDEAYTYMLFHDCGIPLLLRRFPHYFEALKLARESADAPFWQVEEAAVGTHHGAVGYYLARSWGLPHALSQAILAHHDVDAMSDTGVLPVDSRNFVAIGHLAEYLFTASQRGVVEAEWKVFKAPVLAHFGLDDEGLDELADTVEAGLFEAGPEEG